MQSGLWLYTSYLKWLQVIQTRYRLGTFWSSVPRWAVWLLITFLGGLPNQPKLTQWLLPTALSLSSLICIAVGGGRPADVIPRPVFFHTSSLICIAVELFLIWYRRWFFSRSSSLAFPWTGRSCYQTWARTRGLLCNLPRGPLAVMLAAFIELIVLDPSEPGKRGLWWTKPCLQPRYFGHVCQNYPGALHYILKSLTIPATATARWTAGCSSCGCATLTCIRGAAHWCADEWTAGCVYTLMQTSMVDQGS
jgi:hypothetical protein